MISGHDEAVKRAFLGLTQKDQNVNKRRLMHLAFFVKPIDSLYIH